MCYSNRTPDKIRIHEKWNFLPYGVKVLYLNRRGCSIIKLEVSDVDAFVHQFLDFVAWFTYSDYIPDFVFLQFLEHNPPTVNTHSTIIKTSLCEAQCLKDSKMYVMFCVKVYTFSDLLPSFCRVFLEKFIFGQSRNVPAFIYLWLTS